MPLVELPNGQSAVIINRENLSERANRAIVRSYMAAAGAAAKLASSGFDDANPETWGAIAGLAETDQNALDGYQATLICHMVTSWTLGELPTPETVLDLSKATFDALSTACSDEFNQSEDFGPDAVLDPKADIAG